MDWRICRAFFRAQLTMFSRAVPRSCYECLPNRISNHSIRWLSKKKKPSAWMQRHVTDPFVHRARREGHISRAIYKLQDLDIKFKLISKQKPQTVMELGAAPGGWTSHLISNLNKKSTLVTVDLLPLDDSILQLLEQSSLRFDVLQGDFKSMEVQRQLEQYSPFDLILSDMAANTMGDASTDALRTLGLGETALSLALTNLNQKGSFCCKYFMGAGQDELEWRNIAKNYFDKVAVVKPPASRSKSPERYLVAQGFKGI